MSRIFIAVVSHGHERIIKELDCLAGLNEKLKVIVKINKENTDLDYYRLNEIEFIDSDYNLGFGGNNNLIYEYCKESLGMNSNDYYLILNPDVDVDAKLLNDLIVDMKENDRDICTINLFKDRSLTEYDYSVRRFPCFMDFFWSFLGFRNQTIIDKALINNPVVVDWAAGSFLCFKSSTYDELNGFDESYFMYCEDIDICYRAKNKGFNITYYPNYKAIHLASSESRTIFSRHFYWHLKSAIKFIITK